MFIELIKLFSQVSDVAHGPLVFFYWFVDSKILFLPFPQPTQLYI